ncbi:MAG: hypothetical protein HY291_01700 [Planctomycetes bacterium]|nr:hypothetical protein [Planctomycetota bacterium]
MQRPRYNQRMESGPQPFSPPPREQAKPGVWPKVLLALGFASLVALLFYYSLVCNETMQEGLDHAEAPFTSKLRNGGRVVYVTPEAFERLTRLEWTVIAALPALVLLGLGVAAYYMWYGFWSIRFAAILRGLCPRCLMGSIHIKGLKLNERCPVCNASFNREQGYLVGSLYFGYLFGVLLALPSSSCCSITGPTIGAGGSC